MRPCIQHPRSLDSNDVLTEARTVLMRAESALRKVESDLKRNGHREYDYQSQEYFNYEADPDAERVVIALKATIASLDHWRKCRSGCEGRS